MRDFTWKLFCETGDIDTYLLWKELEADHELSDNLLNVEERKSDFIETEL
ncbi:YqzL family protein [Pseudalkalibacillus berkeleyi]|uniref:YqzL family protein n=1 Tax=Pseudalkalibacillus berkeleyi TaxID=1069813 RepID=A0ABS9H2A2_9BACL|nr:YqzL family protein [Pseudalkalibacillus berkeleyi]MCF6137960.1 YqzL family protein [Pseudalkalibacillus berkeleyi]